MPTNNFKLFDENKSNMMTDQEYSIAQQRLNGVQSGVASSQLQNKTLYQTALMCYALAQLMAANGYDANDADAVSTFVNNLSASMVQKVKDRATELEVQNGTDIGKYISPNIFKKFYDVVSPIKNSGAPTESTVGALGQIYIDADEGGRSYICVAINGSKYTWKMIGYVKKHLYTDVITESGKWTVPVGVTSLMVRCFGGGGGGGNSLNGRYAGGGGGYMEYGVVDVQDAESIDIVIGDGGSTQNNGGATSFGSHITAQGGGGGNFSTGIGGGSGGTGGGGDFYYYNGGDGQYGGGGGGGTPNSTSAIGGKGGNGGTYGGGGGGGGCRKSTTADGGTGGIGCGNGGKGGSVNLCTDGEDGTNTLGMGLDFEGEGRGGKIESRFEFYGSGGGGGGGYGGNGGNGVAQSARSHGGGGGGGGYGGNGADGKGFNGGGGGGYGGDADGEGGAGYGPNNYGKGGNSDKKGESGVVVIQYYKYELE